MSQKQWSAKGPKQGHPGTKGSLDLATAGGEILLRAAPNDTSIPPIVSASAGTVLAMTCANVERLPHGPMLLDYLRNIYDINERLMLTQWLVNVEQTCVAKAAGKGAGIPNARGKGAMAEQQVNDSDQSKLSARRPLACGEVWNIATTLVSIDCAASHDARSPLDGNAWHHRVHADQLWDPECGTVDILDKFMDLMTEAGLVQEAQRFVEEQM